MMTSSPSTIILGLGLTGLSCAKFLNARDIDFIMMDNNSAPPQLDAFRQLCPTHSLYLGPFDETILRQASEIIVSPGIDPTKLPILPHQSIINDIELFARHANAPIIGITGSNAKGTVTTLVGHMAQASGLKIKVGGNIGVPALDLLTNDPIDFYILELSSFQLEYTTSLTLYAATLLNITPDHLDRHGTFEHYAAIKQRIYCHTQYAIYNRDDIATTPKTFVPKTLSFGSGNPADGEFGLIQHELAFGSTQVLDTHDLKIRGQHNALNALAALALGLTMHLPMEAMLDTLKTFPGLPHRCQWIATHQGVDWVDDSKGTNVGATLAAITGLGQHIQGKIILIAGGLGKGQDFSPLCEVMSQYVKTLVLMGKDAPLLAHTFQDCCPIIRVNSMQEAVEISAQHASPGDTVLLSPACASWDMFKDYHHRGQVFGTCVKECVRNNSSN